MSEEVYSLATHSQFKSAAWRLFHLTYQVDFPVSFLTTAAYDAKVGYHITGDAELDSLRKNAMTRTHRVPAGLAMLFSEGCPILVHGDQNATLIYNDIRQHLFDWKAAVFDNIHHSLVPIEDLQQFEWLAEGLHERATTFDPIVPQESGIRDALMMINRNRNPSRTRSLSRVRGLDSNGFVKPYEPIVPDIEKALLTY